MISSCPNYLHVDVNDASDLSLHQQEVTGGQLASVTTNLVPGTVRSDVVSEWYRSGIGVSPLLPPPLGARQAEGLSPRSRRAPLAFSQSLYGQSKRSKLDFFEKKIGPGPLELPLLQGHP